MAHSRAHSEVGKQPHSLSLKVLRLAKPSLSVQHPLPQQEDADDQPRLDRRAALAYPAAGEEDDFVLSPVLTLPPVFGAAHVGETFACTLCANNELPADDTNTVAISGVRISAEIQTPNSHGHTGKPLKLRAAADVEDPSAPVNLAAGETLQRIVRSELREEGTHVLSVTVAYTETQLAPGGVAAGGRVRTFRKLYQFNAQQLLSVRTRVQLLPSGSKEERPKTDSSGPVAYAIEAQLENLSDVTVVLDSVKIVPADGFDVQSLNVWELPTSEQNTIKQSPSLAARDILQAAFVVRNNLPHESEETSDGRLIIGHLTIQWRGAMGERGELSTGFLAGKKQ